MSARSIGNSIRYWWDEHGLKVVIRKPSPQWKRTALAAWWFALTLCFLFFLQQFFVIDRGEERIWLFVLLVFLAYYEVRIGKALLWRLYGKELIWTEGDRLYLKFDIRGYGKARPFYIQNIRDLQTIRYSEHSFRKHMESSFWVVGGETLRFQYFGKAIGFGRQIPEADAKALEKVLKKEISERSTISADG